MMSLRACVRCLLLLLVGALLAAGDAVAAERRVALVIGNSEYLHAPLLANPRNDSTAIAAALRRIGFATVELRQDLGRSAMLAALQAFSRDARQADMALVYYAGHGIEIGGRNYLVPADARLATDADAEFEAIPLDLVLRAVEGARRLRVVLLDACRDNPFAQAMVMADGGTRSIGRGLARIEPPGDMLVAYAARDGQVAADGDGRHSPYTEALLAHLETPGLEIQFLFRKVRDAVLAATGNVQQPHVYGSLGGEAYYLVPPAPEPPAEAAVDPESGRDEVELAFWRSIATSREPGDYEEYLRLFPQGVFAGLAKNRLKGLAATVVAQAPAVETSAPETPAPAVPEVAAPMVLAAIPAPVARPADLPGPAGPDLAAIRAELRAVPCSVLEAGLSGGEVTVRGHVFDGEDYREALARLRSLDGVDRLETEVTTLDAEHCQPVELLAFLVRDSRATGATRAMALGRRGETLRFEAGAVSAFADVRIDLYTADGKVRHLHQGAPAADGIRVKPDASAAKAGPALVVVLASRTALALGARPELEARSAYLADLEAAIEGLPRDDLVADVAVIRVRPERPAAKVAGPASPPAPQAATVQATSPKPARCNLLLERAQLGETLSDADRQFLRSDC